MSTVLPCPAKNSLRLQDYEVSESRGFLAAFDPGSVVLPEYLEPACEAARNLPALLPSGRIRKYLSELPRVDLTEFCHSGTDAQHRIAMLRYSFLVQSYVWGESEPPQTLPANLAVPIWQLAKQIGQKPLLPYSSYTLDNWNRFDPNGGFDLSNLQVIQSFLGGQDEAWFILIHVVIEAQAGEILAWIPSLLDAAKVHDYNQLEHGLAAVSIVWDDINETFARMPERCDPFIYYHRVRPWIHGWQDNPALKNGLIYEGVAETRGAPQKFRGQTGSQSSIVPVMDALFSVGHAQDPLRSFLDELHQYRPPAHRGFIDQVRAQSVLRDTIICSERSTLRQLYNDCVTSLTKFRTRHLEYAATYINRQSRSSEGNATDVGTGGTPFMKYLKKHRTETEKHLLALL